MTDYISPFAKVDGTDFGIRFSINVSPDAYHLRSIEPDRIAKVLPTALEKVEDLLLANGYEARWVSVPTKSDQEDTPVSAEVFRFEVFEDRTTDWVAMDIDDLPEHYPDTVRTSVSSIRNYLMLQLLLLIHNLDSGTPPVEDAGTSNRAPSESV